MLTILFVLFVVAGFVFMVSSRWPFSTPAQTERFAWVCWLIASLLWGFTLLGGR